MGCFGLSLLKKKDQHRHTKLYSSNGTTASGSAGFPAFSLADLKAATNNFSSEFIVSERGEKAPNIVYKGRLQNQKWIAVKKFTRLAWPDPKQFAVLFVIQLISIILEYTFAFIEIFMLCSILWRN